MAPPDQKTQNPPKSKKQDKKEESCKPIKSGDFPDPLDPKAPQGSKTILLTYPDKPWTADGVTEPNATVIYAPDPTQLGGKLDILIWFAGHKLRPNQCVHGFYLTGISADQYLAFPELDLRKFIEQSGRKNFVLVVPTLGETSEAPEGLNDPKTAWDFLNKVKDQVTSIAKTVTGIGRIVLAAHSGSGTIIGKWAKWATGESSDFTGTVKEIWCFDSTYDSGNTQNILNWAKHFPTSKLWVFSTGSWWKPKLKDAKKPEGPDNPVVDPHGSRTGTGDNAQDILTYAKKAQAKNIEILIKDGSSKTDDNSYRFQYPVSHDHYSSIKDYFPLLVRDSTLGQKS